MNYLWKRRMTAFSQKRDRKAQTEADIYYISFLYIECTVTTDKKKKLILVNQFFLSHTSTSILSWFD